MGSRLKYRLTKRESATKNPMRIDILRINSSAGMAAIMIGGGGSAHVTTNLS
jgi:hypothetical protein